MYQRPKLERYGKFRDLTAGGGLNPNPDNASIFNLTDLCITLPNGYQCVSV
jgi:hypothetical protein